jgi:hypothetical protein
MAGLLRDLLLVRRRSFHRDGQACVNHLKPALRLFGQENIPISGPCLLSVNHYSRSGFGAWWIAFAVAACVPVEMHWAMTGELTYPGKWFAPLGQVISRRVLARLARVYGFTSMPPMPPRPNDIAARARAVREMLEYARAHPDAVLGLAPEGMDDPSGKLSLPPAGAGRFISLLARAGFPILPVGCYEQEGALCLHFGKQYTLPALSQHSPAERDRLAAEIVMGRIAALLPVELRGEIMVN